MLAHAHRPISIIFLITRKHLSIATRTGHRSTEVAAGLMLPLGRAQPLEREVGKLWASDGEARVKSAL